MASPDLRGAIAAGDVEALPREALTGWASAQRWFSAKSREVQEFSVIDLVVLSTEEPVVAIVIAEARFGSGAHDLYQLPIAVRSGGGEGETEAVICSAGDQVVYDALTDERADAVLAEHFAASTQIERPGGCVRFHWEPRSAPPRRPHARAIGAEQSNSSIVLDDELVLKVFRRIQPGINPELEMLRFLAAHDFENIAAMVGWYEYTGELMNATLGVMQPFIEDARDGWELALDALAAGDSSFLDSLGRLGSITGRMHAVLAHDSSDPDFAPEEPTDEMLALLTATLDEQIERVFDDLPGEVSAISPIAGRGEEVRDHLHSLSGVGVAGRLIRIHGDYHLGQTVRGPGDWVVLDFEGEPDRPLVERRRKRSPLRDVAGMLRSFAYAASAVAILRDVEAPEHWEEEARRHFLAGYMASTDQAILPAGQAAIDRLLGIFELERAIYELRYELNNRPDWVGIPVACITRLLEAAPA